MTDRDRLIKLCQKAQNEWLQKEYCHETNKKLEKYVADYLLANGVIVPPCKVGDRLYAISDTRIIECTCCDMHLDNEINLCATFKCDYECEGCPFNTWVQDYTGEYSCRGEYGDWYFTEADFGKTVFLTKEEAEEKLKEREG